MSAVLTKEIQPLSLVRTLDGRVYGKKLDWDTRTEQPLPSFCQPIREDMIKASALIALRPEADRESIYGAYEHDLKFLQRRLADVVTCVENAVRHSVIRQSRNELGPDKEWDKLKKNIPSFGQINMLDLSADLAAKEPAVLLASLQSSYRSGVTLLLERMCLWFDTLVGFEFVGQVEFTSSETGRYYYYRHSLTQRTKFTEQNTDSEETHDPEVPFGERITYTTSEYRTWAEVHDLELHEHHIVRAREQPIAEFAQPLPVRVKAFVEALPTWLRLHMKVVSGTITLERIIKRKLQEKEGLEVKILNVTKGSPAVVLGHYAFVGWSDDDLRETGGTLSHLQKNYREARTKWWWGVLQWSLCVLLVVGGFAYFISHKISESNAEGAAKYQAFLGAVSGLEQYTIRKNEHVNLPDGQPLAYMGIQKSVAQNRIALTTSVKDGWSNGNYGYYELTLSPDGMKYGFADLAPDLRIPSIIRVINATDDTVTFVVEPNHFTQRR